MVAGLKSTDEQIKRIQELMIIVKSKYGQVIDTKELDEVTFKQAGTLIIALENLIAFFVAEEDYTNYELHCLSKVLLDPKEALKDLRSLKDFFQ